MLTDDETTIMMLRAREERGGPFKGAYAAAADALEAALGRRANPLPVTLETARIMARGLLVDDATH